MGKNQGIAKVLLTGATGFLGSALRKRLSRKGVEVKSTIRKPESFVSSRAKASVIETPDLFNESEDWWADKCEGVDAVIHAAWYAEPGKYLHSTKNLECLEGSLHLARGAVRAGVKKFVGIGTCFEYDLSQRVLSVDTPLAPSSVYASTKAALYFALKDWLPEAGLDFIWCRLFYLYGEGEDERRLVPTLHRKLACGQPVELTSGNQIRDFLEVGEAARKIVASAMGTGKGAQNICSGFPVTVRQLAEKVADEYGRKDLLRFGARPDNAVDPACVLGIPSQLEADRHQ